MKTHYRLLLIITLLLSGSTYAQTPPGVGTHAWAVTYGLASHPWALTMTPGPIGGVSGQLATPLITQFGNPYTVPFEADGYPVLRAGLKYTFALSTAFGGGWESRAGYSSSFDAYIKTISSTGGQLIAASTNVGTSLMVATPSTLPNLKWAYQARPQITANIEDSTYNPPLTSYVPLGATVTNGYLPLATDFYVWSYPSGAVSFLSSNRGATDAINPYYGFSNSSGVFFVTLKTLQPQPNATINCALQDINYQQLTISSSAISFLPAKCKLAFHCTIYYTPKESGFTQANGLDDSLKSAPGSGHSYELDFVKAVKKEGFGKLTVPVNGMQFLAYNSNNGTYGYASTPVGNHGNPLVPCVSCAIKSGSFPQAAHLSTEAPKIASTFGNQNWIVSDIGGLDSDQIDLYYGLDKPAYGDRTRPGSTNYSENLQTPVVFASY